MAPPRQGGRETVAKKARLGVGPHGPPLTLGFIPVSFTSKFTGIFTNITNILGLIG